LGSLGVWLLLFTKNQGREQAALGCVITVFAVQSFVRNVLVLVTHRPLLIIDRRGVTTLESGLVGWAELNRIWTTIQARTYCIAIRFSDPYLQRQPFFVRWLLKIRHFLRHTHMTIPGNGFDVHPNDIIRAIELRHLSGDVQPALPKEVKLPTRVRVARFLALAAAAIPVIRMLLRFPVSEQEIFMYLAAFAIFQTVALLGTPVKAVR
jgi:hypothetical protein